MKKLVATTLVCLATVLSTRLIAGEPIEPTLQKQIDAQVRAVSAWAKDPKVVKAVADHNAKPPADHASMTQDKWKTLTVLDPIVRGLTKNEVAEFLKSKKTDFVTEAFVSDAAGTKVGFLAKTTAWCHKGKPKHDVPMTGKTWQGEIEVDESTGLQQLQISVPVFDGEKPIGSLVVGLSLSKLPKN